MRKALPGGSSAEVIRSAANPTLKYVRSLRERRIRLQERAFVVEGERAVAETNVVILVRQAIDGLAVDMTSRSRFLDRIERRGGAWRILERAAIYEQDRLDPVVPSDAFTRMMQAADVAKYPEPYRYMAYRLAAAGRSLAEPVHYDGARATEALRARYDAWLDGR